MSAVASVQHSLDSFKRTESTLGCAISTLDEHAKTRAVELDKMSGTRGPLHGMTVAVKDNLCTTFSETTCGSKILRGYRSPYNATVIDRLIDAGAIVVAKTNLDEYAMEISRHCRFIKRTLLMTPPDPTQLDRKSVV